MPPRPPPLERRAPCGASRLHACLRAGALAAALGLAAHPGAASAATAAPGGAFDPRVLLELAEQGDARAAFLLGTRFASGDGGVRDDSEAARWFRQAAEAGLAEAQYNLGVLYARGRGVERSAAEAARWYRLAAEQGIAEAQFNLGLMLATGDGVTRDLGAGIAWQRRAAEAGLAGAQHNLGVLHEFGRGVPRDPEAALRWYERAAAGGHAPSRERLAALRERMGLRAEPGAGPDPGPQGGAARPAPVSPVRAADARPVPATTGGGVRARPGAPDAAPWPDVADPVGWVDALDPGAYTVQLISYLDEASARAFLDRHFRPGEAGYFSFERDGRRYYSVVWGQFPSFRAARAAVQGLPEALRRDEPWVRKVRLVHANRAPRPRPAPAAR